MIVHLTYDEADMICDRLLVEISSAEAGDIYLADGDPEGESEALKLVKKGYDKIEAERIKRYEEELTKEFNKSQNELERFKKEIK